MLEYVLVFVILLLGSAALYVLYERFMRPSGPTVAALYVEALQDLLDGRAETAFTKLRQVVAEDSSNIEAYLRLGQILREHKQPDRALQVRQADGEEAGGERHQLRPFGLEPIPVRHRPPRHEAQQRHHQRQRWPDHELLCSD